MLFCNSLLFESVIEVFEQHGEDDDEEEGTGWAALSDSRASLAGVRIVACFGDKEEGSFVHGHDGFNKLRGDSYSDETASKSDMVNFVEGLSPVNQE